MNTQIIACSNQKGGTAKTTTCVNLGIGLARAGKKVLLVELDTLLNMDGRGRSQSESIASKSTRPSVLEGLKRPVPPRNPERKPKQHEEVL